MDSDEPDHVHIEQLEVFACVGVTENERASPQRLLLDITVWPKDAFEAVQDDIARAVNYSAVCATARELMREQSFALIETFAAELAARLLRSFPIQRVHLEIRKFVVPDAQHVSVSLTRSA
ncbi:MAG: dihydroneopterin aldolase [Spartobacteria bacterium]